MSIVDDLAEAALDVPLDDRTRAAAVRCLIDWAGCAVGGADHPAAAATMAALGVVGAGEQATVVGRSRRASPFGAALVNATASHVLDFDDVNITMIGHPAVVVIPAVIALAEAEALPGEAALGAIVGGYEVASRLGSLVNPAHYERGWHATATLGTIAAAAACARLLDLGPKMTPQALATAATSAGGVRAVFGTHGKGFNAGRAASAGLLAAASVRAGLEVDVDALDGRAGFLSASGGSNTTAAAGQDPAILATALKGHAACGATHCLIDAVAQLVASHDLVVDDIERIEATVHPLAVQAAGVASPTTALEAKFSLRHTAAMAAFAHPLRPSAFTDEAVADPAVVALRERVDIAVDEDLRYEQAMPARVVLRRTDGTAVETFVHTPRGRPANPMSDAEVEAKFVDLAKGLLGAAGAAAAANALWDLPAVDDVRTVTRTLVP